MNENLAKLWMHFADTACGDYSPLYDRISRTVAESDDVLELIAQSPPSGHLPTLLLAAVHHLVLGGIDHPLAAVYAGKSNADPGPLFVDVCLSHREEVAALLATRHTNTNEVGRSAVLGPALTEVGRRLGEPLALVDVGCSAGLNLLCDRYLLDYGTRGTTGPDDAPVHLECTVISGDPPIAPRLPPIIDRVGIDRDPVDITNEVDLRWQLACAWPDTGRVERTRFALEELRKSQPRIVKGDAVDALATTILTLPDGAVPVVVTTWAFAYLPVDRRKDFAEQFARVGRERTVAWVSGEGPGVVEHFRDVNAPPVTHGVEASLLGLVVAGPEYVTADLLGFVHPHGSWLDWRA